VVFIVVDPTMDGIVDIVCCCYCIVDTLMLYDSDIITCCDVRVLFPFIGIVFVVDDVDCII
jgi:hypothetical protein